MQICVKHSAASLLRRKLPAMVALLLPVLVQVVYSDGNAFDDESKSRPAVFSRALIIIIFPLHLAKLLQFFFTWIACLLGVVRGP